jgi:hypothetical protein
MYPQCGIDQALSTPPGCSQCMCRSGSYPSAYRHSRRCMQCRQPCSGSSRCPSMDCKCLRRGTDLMLRRRQGSHPYTSRPGMCPSACMRYRPSMPSRRPCSGWSNSLWKARTFPPCGIDREPNTPPGCSQCTYRSDSYPSAYRHSRRCMQCRRPCSGWSRYPSRGCTCLRRGTGQAPCRSHRRMTMSRSDAHRPSQKAPPCSCSHHSPGPRGPRSP